MAVDKTAQAVEALHSTMVMLRQELAKKDHKIKVLESRLNHDLEKIHVEQEEGSEGEPDQEPIETSDLVMEFTVSDDEQFDDENSEYKVHKLKVKEHIDVHWSARSESENQGCYFRNEETAGMTFSPLRPILKLPTRSQLPKSCTGSQTDISAILDDDDDNELEPKSSAAEKSDKKWLSEPSLVHFSSSSSFTKSSSSRSIGCARRISNKKSYELPKQAEIDWEAFDKLKYFNDDHRMCSRLNESHDSGSTDSLIEEADGFLKVAKEKLVTTQDWSDILANKSSSK